MRYLLMDKLSSYPATALEHEFHDLPAWRQAQAMKHKSEEGRRNCILAYMLLCRALKDVYNITHKPTFIIGEYGKPSLAEYPHIHFNLSHCHTAILCAVSDHPIGVDIEWTGRRVRHALIEYTMNAQEQLAIQAGTANHFLRLWTMKEALVKLQGTGLQGKIPELLSPQNTQNISFTTEECTSQEYVFSIAQYKDLL